MNFLSIIFTFLVLLFITCSALGLRIVTGKSIRSPKFHPVAGTVFGLALHFKRLHDYLKEVADQHKTFRLLVTDHSEIYTTDVRNIEYILKSNFEKYPKGKYDQQIVTDLFGEGILSVNGVKWRQQRKLASHEFSTRVLRDFSCTIFRKNGAKLVKIISDFSMANKVFDVQDLLMRFTLDSIFKVGFGVDLNILGGSSKTATAFMKALDDSSEILYFRYIDPIWKLKKILNIGTEAAIKKNIDTIDSFVHEVVSQKRKQLELKQYYNDKEDILTRFLVESEKDPEMMNDQYLRDIILNFLIAGKDTTASTLSWFLYLLCKNPLIQDKIAQEVKEVISSSQASIDDFMANITDDILEKMHYLHAALSETLRLYPAVPLGGRHAETDDTLPDGYRVRKGDGVYYLSYAMARMHNIWGEDAEEFRPERWLKNGIFQPQSPFKFISFHAGPRICLGKDFAYRQMKIVSIALVQFFQFKLADDTKNVSYRSMLTLHVDGGLHLRAQFRPP